MISRETSRRHGHRSHLCIATLIRLSCSWHQRSQPPINEKSHLESLDPDGPHVPCVKEKPSLNGQLLYRDLERKIYLPKLDLSSCQTSQCQEHEKNRHVAGKGEFPTPLHRITIKLPPLKNQQQHQHQHHQHHHQRQQRQQHQYHHHQRQHQKQHQGQRQQQQEQEKQLQLIIQSKTKAMKTNDSKLHPILVKELNQQRGNLWSPTSNGSWDYTTMKTEVNRVLQEELQSVRSTCKQGHISCSKPTPICMKLPQVKPTFCQIQLRDTTTTGNHSSSFVEFPILMAQTQAITVEVQNVEHHYTKRTTNKKSR